MKGIKETKDWTALSYSCRGPVAEKMIEGRWRKQKVFLRNFQ